MKYSRRDKGSKPRTDTRVIDYEVRNLLYRSDQLITNEKWSRQGSGGTLSSSKTWDNAITWDGNGLQSWHECEHTREEYEERRGTLQVNASFWYYPGEYYQTGARFVSSAKQPFVGVGFDVPRDIKTDEKVPAQLDWRAAYNSLLDDASGLMPDDMAIIQNIVEFRQLKTLFSSLSKPITRLYKYIKGHPNKKVEHWYYAVPGQAWSLSHYSIPLRSKKLTLRDLANSHLAYSFGVKPLAEDLGSVLAKYWQVRAHLQWWKNAYRGKVGEFRSQTPIVEQTWIGSRSTRYQSWSSNPEPSSPYWFNPKIQVESSGGVRTQGFLHAKVRADLKEGKALGFALLHQVLGLNAPLQLAWEVTPWSFVVDWFLPVGELIKRCDPRRQIGGLCRNLVVYDVWHTVVHQAVSQITNTLAETEKSVPGYGFSIHSTATLDPVYNAKRYRWYSRRSGLPVLGFVPQFKSNFGLKQAALSLSLIAQKVIR